MWGWTPIVLTTSIGVAVADQSDTLETLMTRADEALYRAKRTGRNRVAA
jgi:diguanylate cyclase